MWSWFQDGSVHRAAWPVAGELTALAGDDADAGLLDLVGNALIGVRGAKTDAKVSMRTNVTLAVIHASAARRGAPASSQRATSRTSAASPSSASRPLMSSGVKVAEITVETAE